MKWLLFVLVLNVNDGTWQQVWYEDAKTFDAEGECVAHFLTMTELRKPEKGEVAGFCTQGRLVMSRSDQFKKE